MFAPLSIPSPDYAWQGIVIPLGQWLHGIIAAIPADYAINIKSYALCILVGIVFAVVLTGRRLTARGAEPGIILDISLFTVPLGIIGARVFHVLTHPADYFGPGKELIKTLYIWEGGIAIFGALIGGAIGAIIACRIYGIRFWSFADALAPGLIIAQAFGRFGNYFNHELFGQPTDLPWGLEIESSNPAYPLGLPDGTLFQPTFLYEIIWNVLGFVVILLVERHWSLQKKTILGLTLPVPTAGAFRLQWGKLLGVYLIWYGAGRVVWESIRVDPSEIFFGLRTNVWAAIFAAVIGIVIIVVQSRSHYGLEPSIYRPGRHRPDVVDSGETYSDVLEPGKGAAAKSEVPVKSGPATSGKGATS